MTALAIPATRRPDVAWALTGLSLAAALLMLPGMALDPRLVGGVAVWTKPVKFALSFVLFFGTIALVADRLSDGGRRSAVVRVALVAMAIAAVGEMAYIIRQAALGEASHFNVGTPWHAAMYTLMGIGAAVLVIGMGALGVRAAVDREAAFGPGVRAGVGLGFAGSAVLTLVTAFVLGGNGGHFVGTPSPGAPVIPFLGWSGEVGDLRAAHFLALHGMQILPLLGIALDRVSPARARTGVLLGAALWCAATVAVFAQAMLGQPLVRL